VKVNVQQTEDRLTLSIQDDGRGFEAQHEKGMGLVGMQERVSHLGGIFAVSSQPGHGTSLNVSLPLHSVVPGEMRTDQSMAGKD
jgi:signal transduction histidine kinase